MEIASQLWNLEIGEVGSRERSANALPGRRAASIIGKLGVEPIDFTGASEVLGIVGNRKERGLARHAVLDGGDHILADAEAIVTVEGQAGMSALEGSVGIERFAQQLRDLFGLNAAILMRDALADPILIERVHGAKFGHAIDAEVETDVGITLRAADADFFFGVTDGHKERTVRLRNFDLGVEPERHHDVFAVEVEVAEIGEVASVFDPEVITRADEEMDERLRAVGKSAVDADAQPPICRQGSIECQAIEEIGRV